MSIDDQGDIQMDFSGVRKLVDKRPKGKLEIEISPSETPEGLAQIIEGYEIVLKRQL